MDSANIEADPATDNGALSALGRKVESVLRELNDDTEQPLYKDPEAQAILGFELSHTPEPCHSTLVLYYYAEKNMAEIAQEIGFRNADTAKAKKYQCMSELTGRVVTALKQAGFDVKPKNRRKNG